MLSVGITEIAERLGNLLSLDQAATKSDVGAVDPNGDIVTGVAGAGVKYLERAKVGRGCWFGQPLAAKVELCCAATILLRGKLVRQRIGISRNPRRMQRVHTAHLVLMRVSHHRQRDRQVDLLLDPVEIWAVWSSVPGGIDHQHAPPSLTIKPLEATAPKPGMSRWEVCCQTFGAGWRKTRSPNRWSPVSICWPIVGRISPGMHPLSINAAANAVLSFATGCIILGNLKLVKLLLRPRANAFDIDLHIKPSIVNLLTGNSVFWAEGGAKVQLNGSGLTVQASPLSRALRGY